MTSLYLQMIGILVTIILVFLAFFSSYRAGGKSIIEKEARDNLKISEDMAKAEADKPASQEDLLERLDKGDA